MENSSLDARRNLPELMDDYFRLYAPIFVRLLQESPKAKGISSFIGRDEPSALLSNAQGQGYSTKAFERKASKLLSPLVDTTMALQASCRVTAGRREPVSVSARRVGDEIAVQVTVSDRLGGIHAIRMGQCAPAEIDAFFLFPPELVVTVGSEDSSVIGDLRSAAAASFWHAVRASEQKDAVLNHRWTDADVVSLDTWLEEFPRNEGDPAVFKKFIAHFHRITAESSHKPLLIMAPVSNLAAVSAKFDRNIVEPLEYPVLATSPVNSSQSFPFMVTRSERMMYIHG